MGFVEAFENLGYEVQNPQQTWSAEKPNGVCITIWKKFLKPRDNRSYYDGWEIWPELVNFRNPAHGNTKLIAHLTSAVEKFNGRVDAIYLLGSPETGYQDAVPWDTVTRGGYWRVTKFNPNTGLYRADLFRPNEPTPAPVIIQRV